MEYEILITREIGMDETFECDSFGDATSDFKMWVERAKSDSDLSMVQLVSEGWEHDVWVR